MKHKRRSLFTRSVSGLLVATQVFLAVPMASAGGSDKPAGKGKPAAPAPAPVKVNRAVPDVVPPATMPQFSTTPTDAEIFRAHVFEEPLVPVGASTAAENQALARAITAYAESSERERVDAFESFLQDHPRSAWRASVLADLGIVYRRSGYFSKALVAWSEAWTLSKDETEAKAHAVADVALSYWATLLARLGRMGELEALLKEVKGRDVRGSAATRLGQAKESLALMRTDPERSFRCGPLALGHLVAIARKSEKPEPRVASFPSTTKGTSLLQMKTLGLEVGLEVAIARREAGAALLAPAIVHWKAGHFAALVREDNGKYLIEDPTFSDAIWMSKAAIDEESTGYMLVMDQPLPAGWRAVTDAEGGTIWGKGAPPAANLADVDCHQASTGGCAGPGMPTAAIQLMSLNVRIGDIPVGYSPPVGPDMSFVVTYNSREAFQPQTFTYSNLGDKWTFGWLSYVQDDPSNPTADAQVYLGGGGAETSTGYDATTHAYAPSQRTGAIVVRTSANPIRYERRYVDGSVDVFSQPDGAASFPRKVLLTSWVDPAGNAATLTYDASLRIVAAADAIGQVTTFSYDIPGDPLRITKVTDPFGRVARFDYNDSGQLSGITDVIGMSSSFTYGQGDFIATMTTPYGTTAFSMNGPYSGSYGSNDSPAITMVDPMGGTDVVMGVGHQQANRFPISSPRPRWASRATTTAWPTAARCTGTSARRRCTPAT